MSPRCPELRLLDKTRPLAFRAYFFLVAALRSHSYHKDCFGGSQAAPCMHLMALMECVLEMVPDPMTGDRRFFETFSFLPPLDDAAIAKQVDYIIRQGWIPALEFANAELAYVKNDSTIRFGGSAPCGYYDNRCRFFYASVNSGLLRLYSKRASSRSGAA